MAVKASNQVTVTDMTDIKSYIRYYLLQASTLAKPDKPTAYPPGGSWTTTEPAYTMDSTDSLYFVDCTVFSDDSFEYSDVSLSSTYEAAKQAFNKAVNAEKTATNFLEYDSENGLQVGNKVNGEWIGHRTQMTADSFNILSTAGEVLASYGAKLIELGKNAASAVIKLCGGLGIIQQSEEGGESFLSFISKRITLDSEDNDGERAMSRIKAKSADANWGIDASASVLAQTYVMNESNTSAKIAMTIMANQLDENNAPVASEASLNLGTVGVETVANITADEVVLSANKRISINGFGFYTDPTVVYLAADSTPYTDADGNYILADSTTGAEMLADTEMYTTGTISGDFRTVGGADSVCPFSSGGTIIKIPSGSLTLTRTSATNMRVDLSARYAAYGTLTADDIVVQILGGAQTTATSGVYSLTKEYDPTTGILTVTSTKGIFSSKDANNVWDIYITKGARIVEA